MNLKCTELDYRVEYGLQNFHYEVLQLEYFHGPFTSSSKPSSRYSNFKEFLGPGKMDTFFKGIQGSWPL